MGSFSPTVGTAGGGSATPVGNQWMNFLGQGLQNGQYGNTPVGSPNGSNGIPPGMGDRSRGYNNQQPNNGGTGTRPLGAGADPTGSTQGFAGAINRGLNSDPSTFTYNNPNNPTPQGYNPTQVGVVPQDLTSIISGLQTQNPGMQFDFNAAQNPGQSGMFTGAQNAQMNLGNMMSQYAQNSANNPFGAAGSGPQAPGVIGYNSINTPNAPGVDQFSSQGILGDRSNVVSGITNAANLARQNSLADARARFTAMGGVSGGTPAAYAEAQANAQGDIGLANSLAQSDINYRNLDLGGYQAFNQANSANYGTSANIYGNQLNALGQQNATNANIFGTQGSMYGDQLQAVNSARNSGLSGLIGAGNMFGNVANNEFNQQQMGFNYDQLGQQGNLANNQMNLNSALGFGDLNQRGMIGAGNLSMANATLGQNAQQSNNANSFNQAQLAQQAYMGRGQLDQNSQQMGYNNMNNIINQLFGSYNGAARQGIPQAETTVTPSDLTSGIQALGGLAGSVAPFFNTSQQPAITPAQQNAMQFTPQVMNPTTQYQQPMGLGTPIQQNYNAFTPTNPWGGSNFSNPSTPQQPQSYPYL
jgi:hypothetical protein